MEYAAKLAAGLRNYSRTIMKMSEQKINFVESMLAHITDRLSILIWQNTEDGHHNRNFPKSIYEQLTADVSDEIMGFKSGAEFMEKWRSL